ncbi:hypothetical protein CRM22_011270 [Opisthorchis felineus]|uniref:Uncharacterized protein n=1 Tax=Opisthorchis felineus TaxID=147828 RepID=A0A4S2JSY2_OPIFE|nr:hypothetical protein CRM22_011270 [Opisthorchis felineus]
MLGVLLILWLTLHCAFSKPLLHTKKAHHISDHSGYHDHHHNGREDDDDDGDEDDHDGDDHDKDDHVGEDHDDNGLDDAEDKHEAADNDHDDDDDHEDDREDDDQDDDDHDDRNHGGHDDYYEEDTHDKTTPTIETGKNDHDDDDDHDEDRDNNDQDDDDHGDKDYGDDDDDDDDDDEDKHEFTTPVEIPGFSNASTFVTNASGPAPGTQSPDNCNCEGNGTEAITSAPTTEVSSTKIPGPGASSPTPETSGEWNETDASGPAPGTQSPDNCNCEGNGTEAITPAPTTEVSSTKIIGPEFTTPVEIPGFSNASTFVTNASSPIPETGGHWNETGASSPAPGTGIPDNCYCEGNRTEATKPANNTEIPPTNIPGPESTPPSEIPQFSSTTDVGTTTAISRRALLPAASLKAWSTTAHLMPLYLKDNLLAHAQRMAVYSFT